MSAFEYLLLFAAVILGLAVSDIAISLHRVLSAGRRVRWDVLAPLAAVVAFLKIVTQWWTWRAAEPLAHGFTYGMFIAVLASAVLLFLLAAASLPDELAGEDVTDLKAHYAEVSRRFWTLFLLQWLLANGVSIWAQVQVGGARLNLWDWRFLLGVLPISLILVRNRVWHGVCLAGFAVLYFVLSFGQTLPG